MADCVHALMDSMQQAAGKSVLDRPASKPDRFELAPRHDPMLPRGELGDGRVGPSVHFPSYVRGNCTLAGHETSVPTRVCRFTTETHQRCTGTPPT